MSKIVCGLLYKNEGSLQRAVVPLQKQFGDIHSESAPYPFTFTHYYEKEMGTGLQRKFIIFNKETHDDELASIKIFTDLIEDGLRKEGRRTVNIDPGILTKQSLTLASNKERPFKQKLQEGIYGHAVYMFSQNGVEIFPHTFPDFKQKHLMEWFFSSR